MHSYFYVALKWLIWMDSDQYEIERYTTSDDAACPVAGSAVVTALWIWSASWRPLLFWCGGGWPWPLDVNSLWSSLR
jgi:hypothetical protein